MKNTPRYAVSPGIPFFLSILLAGSTGASAHAQEVTQMVLVDQPGKPFLIDIFETTEEEFAAVLPAHSKGGSGGGKPARITNGQTAKDYCEAKGKRLPTEAEWMLAASNLGQNKKYSLRGDALYDEKGKLLANLTDSRVYKNSEAVWNFQTVGIDAIGTVGMTGNRPEWVIGEKGTSRCGLSYYASPNNAELEKLCKPSSDTERDGTARCVLDYTDGILVQMGERVTGELRTYVESLFDPAHGWSVRPNLVFAPLPPIKPASSGGSGYSSGSTYSGGTNYSGGSSYSSNADVPDVQILTPRQRKLEFELASTPSDGMVKLSLVFTESKGRMGHEIDLGEMKVSRGKQVFRVDLELIQKIEVDHPRQRAWLKAESGGRELKFSGSGVPVFTSGEKFDYGCDNPVLISDMHNTLDKGDACTKQYFDEFIGLNNLTVFLVSTTGFSAYRDLRAVGFKHEKNILPLDNVGGTGGSEKARRVKDALFSTGACIIGFAGETPEKEGLAAQTLDIPYLGVNQSLRQGRKIRDERVETYLCERNRPQEDDYVQRGPTCEEPFESQEWRLIECEADFYSSGILGIGGGTKVRTETLQIRPEIKGSENKICETYAFRRNGVTDSEAKKIRRSAKPVEKARYCSTKAPRSYVRKDKDEACKVGYNIRDKVDWVPVYGEPEPAYDVNKYPAGSVSTKNWCELVDILVERHKLKGPSSRPRP